MRGILARGSECPFNGVTWLVQGPFGPVNSGTLWFSFLQVYAVYGLSGVLGARRVASAAV